MQMETYLSIIPLLALKLLVTRTIGTNQETALHVQQEWKLIQMQFKKKMLKQMDIKN